LERRVLLSTCSYNSTTHELTITGDANQDDVLSVQVSGGTLTGTDGGVLITGCSFTASSVAWIYINANSGDDTVTIQSSVGSVPTRLRGEGGNDTLTAYSGNDTLEGGLGDDTLAGGLGNDTYWFIATTAFVDLGTDTITENAVAGTDSSVDLLDFTGISGGSGIKYNASQGRATGLDLSVGSNTLQSGIIPSQLSLRLSDGAGIENVYGTAYPDNITGNSRPNLIEGRAGNADKLFAGDGNDTVDGGDGIEDCVHGEAGDDLLYGGAGDGDSVGHDFFTDTHAQPEDGNDTIYGGAGSDSLGGEAGADVMYGEDGDD
jgi:Ca2+-binding RTX toxin-like protein